uniref:Carrier domain-containing protein n=1 Tax=Ditylenchus dipsaci TaxID=166011 RepID=A0A915D0S3_9BILA
MKQGAPTPEYYSSRLECEQIALIRLNYPESVRLEAVSMFRASAAKLFVRCRSAKALSEFSVQPFKPVLSVCGGIVERNEVSNFGVHKRCLSTTSKMFSTHQTFTFKTVKDRIMLNLCLFDKIDPEKLTFDSDLFNDMGLDSLDFVE